MPGSTLNTVGVYSLHFPEQLFFRTTVTANSCFYVVQFEQAACSHFFFISKIEPLFIGYPPFFKSCPTSPALPCYFANLVNDIFFVIMNLDLSSPSTLLTEMLCLWVKHYSAMFTDGFTRMASILQVLRFDISHHTHPLTHTQHRQGQLGPID